MSFSKIESDRFRKSVHRFAFDQIDRHAVRAVRSMRPDIAIVRIPTEEIARVSRLEIFGVSPIVADTLAFYECDLARGAQADIRNGDLSLVEVGGADREMLADLISEVFRGYGNHYASNPLLSRDDIVAGFVEWGLSFLADEPDHVCSVLYDGDRPTAFSTCRRRDDKWEGVLYGVHRDYAGRGVYGDLITLTQREGARRGCSTMVVSTQIQNLAVQRAWVRRGFRLTHSANTIHLNLLLSEDLYLAKAEEEVLVDESLVERFGELVGDRNPVHFDADEATTAGFEDRIAHGALLNGFVSRVMGTQLPGEGTIYLSQSAFYRRPVYLGQRVRVVVRVKHADPASGRMIALTEVLNDTGKTVFLGHAELLNPRVAKALQSELPGKQ